MPVWSQQLECMFLFIQSTELTGEEFHYQKCWCCLATSTFTDAFLFFFLPTSKTSTRPRTSPIVWQSDCGVQQTLLMSLLPCFIYSDASNRLLDAGMNVLGFFFFTGCTEWATEHVKRSTKIAQRSNGIVQVYMKSLWWRVVVFNLYLNIFSLPNYVVYLWLTALWLPAGLPYEIARSQLIYVSYLQFFCASCQ